LQVVELALQTKVLGVLAVVELEVLEHLMGQHLEGVRPQNLI
jgi:hypothetical protein